MSVKVINEKKIKVTIDRLELDIEVPGDMTMVASAEWIGYNYPGYKVLSMKIDEATIEQDVVEIKLVLEIRTNI